MSNFVWHSSSFRDFQNTLKNEDFVIFKIDKNAVNATLNGTYRRLQHNKIGPRHWTNKVILSVALKFKETRLPSLTNLSSISKCLVVIRNLFTICKHCTSLRNKLDHLFIHEICKHLLPRMFKNDCCGCC